MDGMKKQVEKKFRKVGKRNVVVRDDEVEVFKEGEWLIVRIEGWCYGDFENYKIFRDKQAKKNVWQIIFKNGELHHSRDRALLEAHHPKDAEWLIQKITKHVKDGTNGKKSSTDTDTL